MSKPRMEVVRILRPEDPPIKALNTPTKTLLYGPHGEVVSGTRWVWREMDTLKPKGSA